MATATETLPVAEFETGPRPVEFTADQFFGMIEAGLFEPGRRLFLWGGRIYEKMAKSVERTPSSRRGSPASLTLRLPDGWIVWAENPIRLDESHAPLPDIPVVRGDGAEYVRSGRHPAAADVGLIVEVAVTNCPGIWARGPRRSPGRWCPATGWPTRWAGGSSSTAAPGRTGRAAIPSSRHTARTARSPW